MNLPAKRRGLSPEGCRNRERQLGSLTIGLQGVTVHPTHRAGKSDANFIADNVRRLHQIQTKCRQRGTNSRAPQPLRATRHPSLAQLGGNTGVVKRQSVERDGSAHSDYFSLSEDQPDAPPPSLHSAGGIGEDEEQLSHPPSPFHFSQVPLQVSSHEAVSQVSASPQVGRRPPSPVGRNSRPQSPNILASRPQSPAILNSRPQSPIVLEPIATRLTQTKLGRLNFGTRNGVEGCRGMAEVGTSLGGNGRNLGRNVNINGDLDSIGMGVGRIDLTGAGTGLGDGGLLGAGVMSPKSRRQRMDTIMSRIKSQKPSCEVDFSKLYKTIENQHRLLLDSSERLSLYGSCQGSRENLNRSSSRSNSRPGSAGSLRSVSCDRSMQRKANINIGQKLGRSNTMVNEVGGPRQPLHPPSPLMRKKAAKANCNTNGTNPNSFPEGSKMGRKQVAGERIKSSAQAHKRDNLPKLRGLARARSNLERSHAVSDNYAPPTKSRASSKQNQVVDTRINLDCTNSSNGDLNLNSTISSTDFNLGDGNQSARFETDLRLNIRPDSNATVNERGSGQYPDSPCSVLPLDSYNPLYCGQNTGDKDNEDIIEKYLNQSNHSVTSVRENNMEIRQMIDSEMGDRLENFENEDSDRLDNCENSSVTLDNLQQTLTERTDNLENACEITGSLERECRDDNENTDMVTSTPVPNTSDQGTSPSSHSLKVLKKIEGKDGQEEGRGGAGQATGTSRPTLRRSQSPRNINQQQQQQQQKQQRRPGEVPTTYKKGKIPRYLAARREEERQAAAAALAVDPACPPGHSPLPDHDRRNTLHLLRKSQAEVMSELATLPVAQDTLRVKRARQDLEDKLTQIEEGLRIFSQARVYIMNDE